MILPLPHVSAYLANLNAKTRNKAVIRSLDPRYHLPRDAVDKRPPSSRSASETSHPLYTPPIPTATGEKGRARTSAHPSIRFRITGVVSISRLVIHRSKEPLPSVAIVGEGAFTLPPLLLLLLLAQR